MLVRGGAVWKKQVSFGWKTAPKIKPTDFQRAIYVDSSRTCDANPEYINSIRSELSGITGGLIFMLILIQYFNIDPDPNASVNVDCNNVFFFIRVDTPLRKRGNRHHLIPEYNLVNELQRCIKKLRIRINNEPVKGHQDDGSPVDSLP